MVQVGTETEVDPEVETSQRKRQPSCDQVVGGLLLDVERTPGGDGIAESFTLSQLRGRRFFLGWRSRERDDLTVLVAIHGEGTEIPGEVQAKHGEGNGGEFVHKKKGMEGVFRIRAKSELAIRGQEARTASSQQKGVRARVRVSPAA